jgi:hypothetical protein
MSQQALVVVHSVRAATPRRRRFHWPAIEKARTNRPRLFGSFAAAVVRGARPPVENSSRTSVG